MTEVLFFGIAAIIIGLSYFMGRQSGININVKEEVRQFIQDMTVNKMAHDIFMERAKAQTRKLFAILGEKQPKIIKTPKIPTLEEFDRNNHNN